MNIYIEKLQKMDYASQEAYKALRTNIQFLGKEPKVIAFTSCMPNEGKSSVTFNLATSMAEAGKKTLLIDADLRKSVLIGRYKINQGSKGLTHFLSGISPITDVLGTTNVDNFHMILAGPVPPNPSELLGQDKFQELIDVLRNIYDYILVDTPPLGSVIDSAVVARACDGICMVIEANADSYKFAQKVQEQIVMADCRLLGVILNKVNIADKGYYGKCYGKYYGKYYGRYYGNESKSK